MERSAANGRSLRDTRSVLIRTRVRTDEASVTCRVPELPSRKRRSNRSDAGSNAIDAKASEAIAWGVDYHKGDPMPKGR